MSFGTVCLPDSANLLGDVNGYGTPRNTAAASDTARSLKLVDPCSEFVSHPLPVPGECGRAHRSSVDVGMVCREAGIPASPTFRMVVCQIRNLFDGAAEASGTNHRAIRARQTARGNIIPTRMFHIPVKQFLDARGIHRSPHLMNRAINHTPPGVAIVFGCRPERKFVGYFFSTRTSSFNQEFMPAAFQNLCQGKIVAAASHRSRLHRNAETRPAGLAAIHDDNEGGLSPLLIRPIDVGPLEKCPILNGNRVEITRSYSNECVRPNIVHGRNGLKTVGRTPRGHKQRRRWEQILFPGLRANGIAKPSRIVSLFQPVSAAVLFV